jgi:type VII secretion-associated serine protease mycosin
MVRRWFAALSVAIVMALVPPLAYADEIRDAEWQAASLDLGTAHQLTRGDGVTVAIIDTGVDATHPDLQGSLLPGIDLVDPDNDNAWAPEEHGTMVAGVLGGQGHGPGGGDGVLGVAPGARVLPIRASTDEDDDELPSSRLIADAIVRAVDSGASVISISLSISYSEIDERAVAAARRADVVVVAAAGNRPDDDAVTFPAALPTVVAVGAVDSDGDLAEFSVTGPEIALTAPGDEVITTLPGGEYAIASGTSFAAPVVAGAAALVRSRFPDLSAAEVIHRLVTTAADAGPPGQDDEYGYGVVDLVAALTADLPPMPPPADEPDETRLDQWHLESLDLATAHEITRGDGVTVAVVGSGVDGTHPDLHRNTLPGVDLAEPENQDAWTPGTSGTAIAGIIAGHGNRLFDQEPGNSGALGVAPASTILPVRVTGSGVELTDEEAIALAAEGIEAAVAGGAGVICYAAGRASQDLFAEAIEAARAADVVLVAAVGDTPESSAIWFPAAHPAVVAAGGVDRFGGHAGRSVTGPELTLAAPAIDIVTTGPEGGYTELGRTTGAAAMIAGAAALVRAQFPDLSAEEVVHRLVTTADDAGPPGFDEQYGHGILDPVEALTADVPPLAATDDAGPDGGLGPLSPVEVDLGPLALAVLGGALVVVVAGIALLVSHRIRHR